MHFKKFYEFFPVIIIIFLAFISLKVLFPLFLPFLLGGLLSAAAEPAVGFCCKKCHLKRSLSAFLGVMLTLLMVVCIGAVLGGLAVREVKTLTRFLPQLQTTAQEGLDALEQSLTNLSHRLPEAIQPALEQTIEQTFTQDGGLWARSVQKLPQLAADLAGKVPSGALGIGTGLLSAFLISARLPQLRAFLSNRIPNSWHSVFKRLKSTLFQWLKAQGKLMGVTFTIVLMGFLLLKIPYAFVWAALTALVDAVPLLGTGVVLIPWALVKWMQAERFAALGLLCVYAAAALTRVFLEPRLVGKQLGLDPLAALVCLYAGFRLWGFWGLVLAPVGASLVKNLAQKPQSSM